MKRIISILLTAILLISLIPLSAFAADDFTSLDDFNYTFDEENNSVILGEYKGSSDSVTVAAEYEIDSQSYKTVLDSMTVFIKNGSIKSVKICEGVTFLNNSMKALFRECTSLASVDLTGVDTSEITDFSYMFYKCGNIKSLDVTGFVTENATTIRSMFYYCSALTSITGLDTWNTSNVTEMNFVFYYCSSLKTLDLSAFTTDNATTFRSLFCYCSALTSINGAENFNTSNITDFSYMFYGCSSLKTIDVSNYDTGNSEAFRAFVYNCTSLTSITGLDNLNTEKATDLSFMFYNCTGIKTLDLSSFDTSSVTSIRGIFSGCNHLSKITGLSGWNTSSLEDMSYAFNNVANALSASTQVVIDMSRWDLDQIKTNGWCFQNCKAQQIIVPDNLGLISAGFMNHAVRYAGSTFTVPAGVKKIGYAHTFYDFATNDFTEFIVAEGNTNYKTVDGILYSADGKEMLAVPRNKPFENGVFEIPDGVEFFGELSFSRNYNIHTVVLPDTYKIKYVPLYDDRYIVYDDTGNLNAGSNLSIAIYCYTGITDYEVKPTNPNYSSVDGIVYSKDLTHVAAIPARYNKVMNIPEGVKVWDSDAMWADGSATVDNLLANSSGVVLPSTLTTIDALQLEMLNRIRKSRVSGDNPFTITLSENNEVFYLDEDGYIHPHETDTFYLDFGDVTFSDESVEGYDVYGNLVTSGIKDSNTITQLDSSLPVDHCITVLSGNHKIVLDNINVSRQTDDGKGFSVQGSSEVSLTINGTNRIKSGSDSSGIEIDTTASLTVNGDGEINAESPLKAGIGSMSDKDNGTLVINSGYIVASGGENSAGIGGCSGCSGGNITINGGTVTSHGGTNGAGIGGGYSANGGNIVINGGTVKALGGENADEIGNGAECENAFSGIYNQSGNVVSLNILKAENAERVYFNGIQGETLKHHPVDENYYFYTDNSSFVTVYGKYTVKYYFGSDLMQAEPFISPSKRTASYLITDNPDSFISNSSFSYTDGLLYYRDKCVDEFTPILRGDLNLDGSVDGEDSVLAACILEGILTQEMIEEKLYTAADYDLNGGITADDVSLLEVKGLLY